MEMLLVLAILVITAALSAPALRGVMRNAELTSAAEKVRTEWTRGHVLAMKTGRIHVFRYEPSGRKYKTEPWLADDDALESATGEGTARLAQPAPATATMPSQSDPTGGKNQLPEGTKFIEGDLASDNRTTAIENGLAQMASDGGDWSRPILFFPDGSSSDAYVVVGNDRQVGRKVELRGLTGVVKVSDISSLATFEKR